MNIMHNAFELIGGHLTDTPEQLLTLCKNREPFVDDPDALQEAYLELIHPIRRIKSELGLLYPDAFVSLDKFAKTLNESKSVQSTVTAIISVVQQLNALALEDMKQQINDLRIISGISPLLNTSPLTCAIGDYQTDFSKYIISYINVQPLDVYISLMNELNRTKSYEYEFVRKLYANYIVCIDAKTRELSLECLPIIATIKNTTNSFASSEKLDVSSFGHNIELLCSKLYTLDKLNYPLISIGKTEYVQATSFQTFGHLLYDFVFQLIDTTYESYKEFLLRLPGDEGRSSNASISEAAQAILAYPRILWESEKYYSYLLQLIDKLCVSFHDDNTLLTHLTKLKANVSRSHDYVSWEYQQSPIKYQEAIKYQEGGENASPPTKQSPSNTQTSRVNQQSAPPTSNGCYVATCVYGSYDCPQVWTLRRYRDYALGTTWHGRLFIRLYYAISPTLVRMFGNTFWFRSIFKKLLDKKVFNLQQAGTPCTPYIDVDWRNNNTKH